MNVVYSQIGGVVGRQGELEARDGGVTGDEDGGELGPRHGLRESRFPRANEVSHERRHPGNGEDSGAAPAVAGKGRADEVHGGGAA